MPPTSWATSAWERLATEVGLEPTHCLIQSQVPFQLGYSVKDYGEPGTVRTCDLDLRRVAL